MKKGKKIKGRGLWLWKRRSMKGRKKDWMKKKVEGSIRLSDGVTAS